MKLPLISVVIPNYNYAGFLPEAIRSAADQTYPEKELIVVDDCSKDKSMEVLGDLRRNLGHLFSGGFRIEQNACNMGAHETLNYGIAISKGEYVAIMNADDLFQSNRLVAMSSAMQSSGARLAFSDVSCIDGGGNRLNTPFASKLRSLPGSAAGKPFAALAAVAENIAVSTGNMMMTKTLHQELGGFRSYRYVHDYDFLFRALLASEPVYVPETDYLYRIHGNNTFTKLQNIGIAENRLIWLEMYEAVKNGRVTNSVILEHPDYARMFRDAAYAYGFQKKVMWRIAGTPLGSLVAAAMRAKLSKTLKI